jgi:hypothetical protein
MGKRRKDLREEQMDPQLTAALKAALNLWVSAAMRYIDGRPVQMAELRKCMEGDGEVRIIYHVKANAITIEAIDHAERTFAELFRQQLVPGDIGFALPDSKGMH